MFEDVNIYVVMIPLLVVGGIVLSMAKRKIDQEPEPIRSFKMLRLHFALTVVVVITLWFFLPTTPTLATFGYPQEVNNIQNPELLLGYLQRYNKAIVRTTEVVQIFLMWFALMLVVAHSTLSKAISSARVPNASEAHSHTSLGRA
jgi:hypothetical protein